MLAVLLTQKQLTSSTGIIEFGRISENYSILLPNRSPCTARTLLAIPDHINQLYRTILSIQMHFYDQVIIWWRATTRHKSSFFTKKIHSIFDKSCFRRFSNSRGSQSMLSSFLALFSSSAAPVSLRTVIYLDFYDDFVSFEMGFLPKFCQIRPPRYWT